MVSTYNQVCPVIFGVGATKELGKKAKEIGGKKALCIYDSGVKMSGIADRLIKLLGEEEIETVIFDGVLPDAPDKLVDQVGEMARQNKVDLIIGIGGGSSLDTAKAVSVLIDNPGSINQYYASCGNPFKVKAPLILVPTSAGTGSEVTVMSVIHDHQTHIKEAVLRHADFAIVDPELTITVPPHVTAATGIDALSHAIESYTTNCGNPKSDALSLIAVEFIVGNLEKAYHCGSDLESRTNLSFASNIAGMCFSDASVHFGHAVAHEFGTRFQMPHGLACAITLPEVIAFAAHSIPEKACKIAKAVGIEIPKGMSGTQAGELAATEIRKLMRVVDIKSLSEQGISREEAVACAEAAIKKNWFISCAPKLIDTPLMEKLIGKMYDNY